MNTVSAGAVLQILNGATEMGRLPVWAASTASTSSLRRILKLSVSEAASLFLGTLPLAYVARQHVALGLRWCPRCATDWFHSARFQDRRVRRCPWHGCGLLESCPRCGRGIDPLGQPWECSHCAQPLAPTPDDWIRLFKGKPAHLGAWPSSNAAELLGYQAEEGVVVCFPDDQAQAFVRNPRADEYWRHHQLFEAASALWDGLLSEHRECALHEHPYNDSLHGFKFECPVAAAARNVFGHLGRVGEGEGPWPVSFGKDVGSRVLRGLENAPREVQRAMLAELTKRWLLDALLMFSDVARAGRNVLSWEPESVPHEFLPKVPALDGAIYRLQTTRLEILRSCKTYAGQLCRRKPDLGIWLPEALLGAF